MAVKKSGGTSQDTRTLVTILVLFFVPLIGIILMWFWSGWKTWIKIVLTVFYIIFTLIVLPILFILFYAFIVRPFEVNGNSMNPTYQTGEYIASHPYSVKTPLNRGDVVIYAGPDGKDYIKRVIGLPGETIKLHESIVYINGQKLDESAYISAGAETYPGPFLEEEKEILIPDNSYFLMGDNRPQSVDSREMGFVPAADIVSIGGVCYWNCK